MSSAGSRNWPRRVRALNDRKTRLQEGVVFVEGIRQVLDAYEGGHTIEAILVDPTRLRSELAWQFIDRAAGEGIEVAQLSPAEFERISSRENPVGMAATVHWKPLDLRYAELAAEGVYLATDDVRDPGNLGTIIRAADAAGADGVVLTGRTVDPYNPKVVRATTGSLFHVPLAVGGELESVVQRAHDAGLQVLAADVGGDDLLVARTEGVLAGPTAWVFGNEARGLDEASVALADRALRLPIFGRAESLNLATAASVCLYESAFAQRA